MNRFACDTPKSAPRFVQNADVSSAPRARAMVSANCVYVGNASIARVTRVQYSGCLGEKSQLLRSITNIAISVRLRRRLSNIFQREMIDSGLCTIFPKKSGTRGNSQKMICQSPRTQRCFLRLNALMCDG